jgi:hypothetical protein
MTRDEGNIKRKITLYKSPNTHNKLLTFHNPCFYGVMMTTMLMIEITINIPSIITKSKNKIIETHLYNIMQMVDDAS